MRYFSKLFSLILALLLFISIFTPTSYAAPQTIPLQDNYLSIMPEYDNNNVIVNFSGNLVNTTGQDFSGEVWYYVPKDAQIYMVCETEKGMVCVTYNDQTVEGDYRIVKWTPSRVIKPRERFPVMFEYFFNSFTQAGERDFQVNFKTDSALTNLTVGVKQPLRSSDFKMDPAPQTMQQDGEGFTNHLVQYPTLESLQELNFAISYTKPDAQPSIEVNDTRTAAGTTGQEKSKNNFTIALFLIFLLILGAVLFFGLRANNISSKARPKPKKRRQAQAIQANSQQPRNNKKNQAQGVKHLEEKKKIRKLLLDGKITEQTYYQLLDELE